MNKQINKKLKQYQIRKRRRRDKILQKLPRFIYSDNVRRLTLINQRSNAENLWLGTKISLVIGLLGSIYLIISFSLFHALWYHNAISIMSTFLFMYMLREGYFEKIEYNIKDELPNICNKLTHYYAHLDGNLIPAMQRTEARTSPATRIFVTRIREALESENCDSEIKKLQERMSSVWLKMLCTILLFGKKIGGTVFNNAGERTGENVISKVLEKLSVIIDFNNLQQGYNDSEMKSYQYFVFFSPMAAIIAIKGYYSYFSRYIDVMSIYEKPQAQTLVAVMFLSANLGALFIHWIRKNQS